MKIKFIDKTLAEISDFFKWGLFAEKYARKNGVLQKVNPKIKLIYLIFFLVYINFIHNPAYLAFYYLNILMLAYFSKVDLGFFVKRIMVIAPVFAGIVLLPSVLNIAVPGNPLIHITKDIYITQEGINLALIGMLRVLNSISMVILISITTPWQEILKSLEILRVPKVFIMILNMTYRYLFLLIKSLEESHLMLKSRLIYKPDLRNSYKLISAQILSIQKKSSSLTDQTYKAMISRGYRGGI